MLNEIKEFEQYTYSLESAKPEKRLKQNTLCADLSGIARAMTVIARKSFFENSGPERIDIVRNDLQLWCGDPKGEPEKASEGFASAWLPEYMVKILGEEKALAFEYYLMETEGLDSLPRYREVCDTYKDIRAGFNTKTFQVAGKRREIMDKAQMLQMYCKELGVDEQQRKKTSSMYAPVFRVLRALNLLSGKYGAKGFNKNIFSTDLNRTEKNDYKKIMYDKIIADAIAAGPLKRYYLVCENDDLSGIRHTTKKLKSFLFRNNGVMEKWSNPTKVKADLIKKTVAAFLLEQKLRHADNQYEGTAPVNLTDISNWLAGSTGTDNLLAFDIEDRPLFIFDTTDNVAAIGIDNQWMEMCGWKVLPEDELDAYISEHPRAVYYSDPGAGQYLQKQVRYSAFNRGLD